MSNIYFCTREGNECHIRDTCKRYIDSENEDKTTLLKAACTDANDYVLFIKHEEKDGDT